MFSWLKARLATKKEVKEEERKAQEDAARKAYLDTELWPSRLPKKPVVQARPTVTRVSSTTTTIVQKPADNLASDLLNPLNPLSPISVWDSSPASSEPASSPSSCDSSSSSYDSGSSSSYDSGSCGSSDSGGGSFDSGSF